MAIGTVADGLHIKILFVSGPVMLEIVKERCPVERKMVLFKVAKGKRKYVIDTDQRGHVFGKKLCQPVCQSTAGPVFPRTDRRQNLARRGGSICNIHTQAGKASVRSLGTGVVNAEIPAECRGATHNRLFSNFYRAHSVRPRDAHDRHPKLLQRPQKQNGQK